MDTWPMGRHYPVKAPTSLEERISNATNFRNDFALEIPLVLDSMENIFEGVFTSHPERFFIIKGDTLFHKAVPKGACYDLDLIPQLLGA